MADIVLLGHTFWEHSKFSGYSRIADFIPNAKKYIYFRDKKLNFFKRIITGGAKRISETRWFTWDSLKRQLAVCKEVRENHNRKLFHFLYGENGFFWAAHFAKKHGHFICATFHNTTEMLESMFRNYDAFMCLDAVIVMSRAQIEFFEKVKYKGKIYVIPHGIDTLCFSPDKKEHLANSIVCISTGFFERDYETIRELAEKLKGYDKIKFVIVSSNQTCKQFIGMANVKTYSNIPDDELLVLYRNSDLFLIFFKSATVSNSLLEAMSCGLPIITEDVGGVSEYVTKNCSIFVNKDNIEEVCEILKRLSNSRDQLRKMSLASRERALGLDWQKIADMTMEVYADIAKGR